MRVPVGWAIALVVWMPVSAAACEDGAATMPYAERLKKAPIAFVGTVSEVRGSRFLFKVHQVIAGTVDEEVVVGALPPSTCAISFAVGQRWLYAGPEAGGASRLLIRNASQVPASDFGPLQRLDDAWGGFPAAWQACTTHAQCERVVIGCKTTAANTASAQQAQDRAIKVYGDHRAMSCASTSADMLHLPRPLCVAERCGVWVLDYGTSKRQ